MSDAEQVNDATCTVPIPDDVRAAMQKLLFDARDAMPPGWGVTVLVFAYDGSATLYASTAERGGMIRAMREFVVRAVNGAP